MIWQLCIVKCKSSTSGIIACTSLKIHHEIQNFQHNFNLTRVHNLKETWTIFKRRLGKLFCNIFTGKLSQRSSNKQ